MEEAAGRVLEGRRGDTCMRENAREGEKHSEKWIMYFSKRQYVHNFEDDNEGWILRYDD